MRPVLRWVAAATVVGVVGIGTAFAAVALAADDDPADRYRLTTATVGDVAQTLPTNGTVDFVNRADVSFGTGGTLAELSVAQGDQVSAGQRLAALDSAGPRAAVDSAAADLADAKATLEADQQRQEDAVDTDSESDSQSNNETDTGTDQSARLKQPQQAVRTAQTAASKAIAAAKAALAAQSRACARETDPLAHEETAEPAPACTEALAAAMAAQDAVAEAQNTLQRMVDELAAALATESSEVDSPAADPNHDADSAPTAATIAADQAAVDTATADLLAAKQALAQATLTAPIAGTVASVAAAEGDDVTAGSAVLVLIGSGAAVVETTVPVERIGEVEVGQTATVTPTGAATGVEGTVSRIGRLTADAGTDAGTGSVAYPVTVTVAEPPATMPAGSSAGVAIVVDTAEDVLTVPTSAVHREGATTVTVLDGTEAAPREVTIGAVGPLRTEILGGLDEGERVVLADLTAPLPSAEQQSGPGGPGGDVRMGGPGLTVRSGPGGP